MQTVFNALVVLVFFLFLGGCHNYDKEIQQIEVLESRLDSVSDQITVIDTSRVNECHQILKSYVSSIQEKHSDKLSKDQGFMYASYKRIKKSLSRFNRTYYHTKNQIDTTALQLQRLKHDLKNGSIDDAQKIEKYLSDEHKINKEIVDEIPRLIKWYETSTEAFDELHPKMKHLLDSLDQLP